MSRAEPHARRSARRASTATACTTVSALSFATARSDTRRAPPPSAPPSPPPPSPCPNLVTTWWNVCSLTTGACSVTSLATCASSNVTTFTTSNDQYTQTSAPSGRRLSQTSGSFFLGRMAAAFNLNDPVKPFRVQQDTVQINLGWQYWPSAAQSGCLTVYTLAQCQDLAATMGNYTDGRVDLKADWGTLTLIGHRTSATTYIYANSTCVPRAARCPCAR